jgi:hypothetical protein
MLLLSIYSLRWRNKKAKITLLTDEQTAATFTGKRREILELIDEHRVIKVPVSFSLQQRSRFIKTSMRQHVRGDFLFVDCDTVIADKLSVAKNAVGGKHLSATLDQNCELTQNVFKREIQATDKKLGYISTFITDKHYSSGVIFCRDTPKVRDFFREWHQLWYNGLVKKINIDQAAFNQANMNVGNLIVELDGSWNYQVRWCRKLRYLLNAKVIHYQGSYMYDIVQQVLQDLKKNPTRITPQMQTLFDQPKNCFVRNFRYLSDNMLESGWVDFFEKHNLVYRCCSKLLTRARQIKKYVCC